MLEEDGKGQIGMWGTFVCPKSITQNFPPEYSASFENVNIPKEILENEELDRLDIFDFRGEFKKRLAVNLEVLNKSHRAIENFFALCKVTV